MLQALSDFISKVTRGEKLTIGGAQAQWKKVSELTPGLMIAVPKEETMDKWLNGQMVDNNVTIQQCNHSDVEFDEIVSIRRLPPERVWDIEVEGTHNFVANGIFAHNTVGKALAVFNETGDQNILVASASGATQFSVGRTGIVTGAQFQDQADTTYFLDPAASGTGLKLNGNVELTGGGTIASTANGNITIDAGSGTVCIGVAGTCAGKLDSGTLDPPYTINGKKYATYVPSMVGIKEETTGMVETKAISRQSSAVIDFKNQEEGSDLWLFSKVTALKKHINQMTVLLSAASNTRSWYEVDEEALRLTIYTSRPTTVSYRLSAPRFDAEAWQNTRDEGSIGHIINDPDEPPSSMDETGYLSGVSLTLALKRSHPASQGETLQGIDAVELGPSQTFGIYNKEGVPAAVFDEKGNATFSGELSAISLQLSDSLKAESLELKASASIAGTLYADRIVTRFGDLEDQLSVLRSQFSASGQPVVSQSVSETDKPKTDELKSENGQLKTDNSIDATSSALLALLLNQESGIRNQGEDLILNSLLVSGPLLIGRDGISATSDTLYIEKGQTAALDIMAGTIVVNTAGDVIITGNLAVSGNVAIGGVLGVNRISPSEGELTIDLTKYGGTGTESSGLVSRFGRLIIEQEGKEVAAITASGAGVFRKLIIDEASASGTIATPSAGLATLPAGGTDVTIATPHVTNASLIYVTPVSTTNNQVLYIKRKEEGVSFTVAVDQPVTADIRFNWWIIN